MNAMRNGFLILVALFLLAGLATGGRVWYLLLAMSLLLTLASLLISAFAAWAFAYTQQLSKTRVTRGERVEYHLTLHNENALPYPLMIIRLNTPDPEKNRSLSLNLEAHAAQSFNEIFNCPHRGRYDIGMTVIEFSDPFGLFSVPFNMRNLPYFKIQDLLVLPRITKLPRTDLQSLAGKLQRSGRSLATEDASEPFSEIREFKKGDKLKRIHWPASIRQRRLMTRQYDRFDEPEVSVLLDLSSIDDRPDRRLDDIDRICEAAASLSALILGGGQTLRIIGSASPRPSIQARSPADLSKLLRWLAEISFSGSELVSRLLSEQLRQPDRHLVIMLILQQKDPDLLQVLGQVRNKMIEILPVLTGPVLEDAAYIARIQRSGLRVWTYRGDEVTG